MSHPVRGSEKEAERLSDAYERRERDVVEQIDRWFLGDLFIRQERQRVMLDLLRRHSFFPLADRKIIDVGCGSGKVLADLLIAGARPENLWGIDLRPDRISFAQSLNPHFQFSVADAIELPFGNETFDLALAFTTFSAMTDPRRQEMAAAEIARVLRPHGAVLWYDFWLNPSNVDVRPLGLRRLRQLFPAWGIDAKRVTLIPPLARRIARYSWLACNVLAAVPLLRTHWAALIRKPAARS